MDSTKSKETKKTSTHLTKTQLKILTWNIQSSKTSSINKFHDLSFSHIISDHDIVCLQEIRQAVKLPGFRSVCNLRPGEKHGGVGILYKNEFIGGVEIVNKHNLDDVIICKLKKSFFKFDKDLYIININVTPFNSSAVKSNSIIDGRELRHKVEDIVNDLQASGDILICGDFNSRISDNPGLIKYEHENIDEHIPLPDDYIPDNFTIRCTQDRHTNMYGKDFLSLVLNNRLTILNGRTLGDLTGAITCIRPNGCSVVDYFAVSSPLLSLVTSMCVLSFTQFSDHKPLSLSISTSQLNLNTNKSIEASYKPAPLRFTFDTDSKAKLLNIQQDEQYTRQLNNIKNMLTDFESGHDNTNNITGLNDIYVKYLQDMASQCLNTTKMNNTNKRKNKNNPWFNWQCRLGKRELNKAARATSKFPSSEFLRLNYYKVKKSYKSLIKKHRDNFFDKINRDIENGKILNWQQFKRLKSHKSDKIKFDSHDMNNFENFFRKLYSDEHKTMDANTKQTYLDTADQMNITSTSAPTLNETISIDEVANSISSLKTGKASSLDMINNEIIKSLNDCNVALLTKLFNVCLESGSYPWNANVITPLHKKGNKDDPDNYRAIAVSSVLGKLFSTILLDRLIKFRNEHCPDPPNQLGFTKKAQTYDHILTMQTITSKYKKLRKNVYAIFVDFRKAFDSVCRQALFYKLAQNGITGNFYNVLRDMYANSYAHIKISGHLSNKFKIMKGTEQGHPLSPDLFKIFLSDLSPLLEFDNCPTLTDILVSHLLWADDLILLSLDQKTTQIQLNRLSKFCNDWGIEINELKTKTIVFGKVNKRNSNPTFHINNKPIENVDSYCYLGIVLHKSGSLKTATLNLRNKAMRSLYGLKRTVNKSKLSFRALTTLFDSLIKPIILYGAPIWTPTSSIIKNLSSAILSQPQNLHNIIPKINRVPSERLHQHFLKWALGLHRKASNIGAWGESGRYPLAYQSIKLTLNYYQRLTKLSHDKFVYAALQEQKLLNLPWYKNIESLTKIDQIFNQDHVTAFQTKTQSNKNQTAPIIPMTPPNYSKSSQDLLKELSSLRSTKPLPSKQFRPTHVLKCLREHFKNCWEYEKSKSPKLNFYHSTKSIFEKEPYLDVINNAASRYRITRLRISAHDLEIETGRYSNTPRENRVCKWCLLTLSDNIIENETHMLYHCDLYSELRSKLIKSLNKSYPTNNSPIILNFNSSNFLESEHTLMNLLSPNVDTEFDLENPILYHHQNNDQHSLHTLRSHILNAIGSFIGKCFDKRWSFLTELKKASIT